MKKKMNEKESIDLIASMIRNTQEKMEHNSGRFFLLFGYLSVVVAVAVWYATVSTGDYRWNYLWFIIPLIGWGVQFGMMSKRHFVKTFVDRIVNYIWVVLGVAILIACLLSIHFWEMESLFFSALMIGAGATLTGLVVKVKSVAVTGFLGMLISPIVLFLEGGNQILVFAAMFVMIFIIPGHILHHNSKKKA